MHTRLMRLILSRIDPRAAPIITRLANLAKNPSLEVTVGIGALSLVFGFSLCAFYLYAVNLQSTARFVTGAYILFAVVAFMLTAMVGLVLLPHITATATAMLVSREVLSDEFSLLLLTNINGQALFQGYFFAALYRARLLLALHLGIIPLFAFLMTLASPAIWIPSWGILLDVDFIYRVVYYTLMGIALWGMNLISIVHAINTSFGGRFTRWATWLTPMQILIALVITGLGVSSVFEPMLSVSLRVLFPLVVPLPMIAAFVIAIVPFAGAWRALRKSTRGLPRRPAAR